MGTHPIFESDFDCLTDEGLTGIMFITVSIYRYSDGLPVSASSEFSQDKNLIDCRRLIKGIATRFPDYQKRCVLHNKGFTIGWQRDGDIVVMGLIDSRTAPVDLFHFLKIVGDMFWNAYDANKVTQAQRPFAFIDFDATIEKNRRKCNKKQLDIDETLVKEIEAELERHPAQVISDKALRVELGRKEGQSRFRTKKFQGTRHSITSIIRLPAPTIIDLVFIVITLGTGALSFARGHQIATHQWKQWNVENHTSSEEFVHIVTFKGTLLLSTLQVFMMLFWFSFRKLINVLNFGLLMTACFIEFDNRPIYSSTLFILVHLLVTVKIHRRGSSDKSKSF